jgi:hypothetical protein
MPPPLLLDGTMSFPLYADLMIRNNMCVQGIPQKSINPVPVYAMVIDWGQRMRAITDLKSIVAKRLVINGTEYPTIRVRRRMIECISKRVATSSIDTTPEALYAKAMELQLKGQCVDAVKNLERAIVLGHLPSRAALAEILTKGREGISQDHKRAYVLVKEGDMHGCWHCQGVLSMFYLYQYGCKQNEARSLELAHMSAAKGSKFGLNMLGVFYEFGAKGFATNDSLAYAQYRIAASQGHDDSMVSCGLYHQNGWSVAQDYTEALRWFRLAAEQGLSKALYMVGTYHEHGRGGVSADMNEANRWYRRATIAGYPL